MITAGMYCLYSPTEIVLAEGAIPIPLCGTSQVPISVAEKVLPRNLCLDYYGHRRERSLLME